MQRAKALRSHIHDSPDVRFVKTTTETAASASPSDYQYNPVPEDTRRYHALEGGTNVAPNINATINALNAGSIKGGVVKNHGDANSNFGIAASISIPARASGDNHTRWYSFQGMGRGSPRITALSGMTDFPMIDATGQDASTYSFYREFKDMYLQGASIANRGIELYYNQHFKVENVFITGMSDGSSAHSAAGVRVFGAICAQFRDLKVHDGNGYGIYCQGGSGNFFNANLVAGCSFLNLSDDGFYASGGASGDAWIGSTFEKCNYGARFAGYSGTCGLFGGNYLEDNALGDLYIGEETQANSLVVTGNYMNGYTGGSHSATSYTPIRMKFADGVVIKGNMVALTAQSATGYLLLDANIAGGSVAYCAVENNQVRSLSAATSPRAVYNLPSNWVDEGNSIVDDKFCPLHPTNMVPELLPYGGWTISVSGTGSVSRHPSQLFGRPSVNMQRPAASTCQLSRTYTLETGSPAKNRFVTFAIAVRAGVANQTIQITATPDGTSPQTATISRASLANGDNAIMYAMCFVPSDATQIALAVTLTTDTGNFIVGQPCLYVGARRWYNANGLQDWSNAGASAPSTGTWAQGDRVWRSDATSGAAMGFVCTVAGAPGTWKAMGNLA